ncbi:spore coat protein GerQ [Bacillus pumilus]|uniref:Spore coat protein GerQ n=1 Tax=Bacillus pumilus TaxID=1408 RepID=A0AAD0HRP7_BACPU|nr:spore coat protein GerQ [Bacillus pumilus]AVM25819.1 spore coat protein GerQ [Bacillus pumilus]TYS41842.1 spore coat protein GerQ [Bacillus pumilus]
MKLKNQFGQGSGFEGQDFRQQQYGANPYPAQQMGYSVPPQTQGQMQGQMQQGFSPMPSTGTLQGGQGSQSGGQPYQIPSGPIYQQNVTGQLPLEQSYIENILRLNRGKVATIYMTFEASKEWNSKIFRGVIEAAGRDHIIISDNKSGTRYLLLTIYLDYITFDGEIQYDYPYSMSTYSPR